MSRVSNHPGSAAAGGRETRQSELTEREPSDACKAPDIGDNPCSTNATRSGREALRAAREM